MRHWEHARRGVDIKCGKIFLIRSDNKNQQVTDIVATAYQVHFA